MQKLNYENEEIFIDDTSNITISKLSSITDSKNSFQISSNWIELFNDAARLDLIVEIRNED